MVQKTQLFRFHLVGTLLLLTGDFILKTQLSLFIWFLGGALISCWFGLTLIYLVNVLQSAPQFFGIVKSRAFYNKTKYLIVHKMKELN